MKTEIKILKILIEHREPLTIRALAIKVGSDYKIIHTAVKLLLKKDLVIEKRVGSAIEIVISNKFSKEIFEAEFERRETFLRDKRFSAMIHHIKRNIGTKNFILLLFGSYAKRNQTKNSDIDLMFIVPTEEYEKKIESILSSIPLPIQSHVFTERQFIKMKNIKEFNVGNEAIKHNIILYGIEQYYELLMVF